MPVTARSVVTPVLFGGGGGGSVLTLALWLTRGVPASSVPLTVAELVMAWSCLIWTMKGMRTTAPGFIAPILQEKVTTPDPPAVQVATPPDTDTILAIGRIVAVPDPLVAAGPACEYVKVVLDGVFVTTNVPLNEGSATPAILTCWLKANDAGAETVTVTTPLALREIEEMFDGTVLSVFATETFAAGKFDVFVTVMV